jgi:hypothetical protein
MMLLPDFLFRSGRKLEAGRVKFMESGPQSGFYAAYNSDCK